MMMRKGKKLFMGFERRALSFVPLRRGVVFVKRPLFLCVSSVFLCRHKNHL